VDVGSTYTKGAAVHAETGALLAVATHPTTLTPDVLVGLDAVRADLAAQVEQLVVDEVLVCSSAGGGLRLAVVGYERAVTAEAGYLVGLSAGARVVHVAAGRLDVAGIAALVDSRPDVVLLVGGTDNGDTEVIVHNGDRIARSHLRCPVVVAGNAEVASSVATALTVRGKHVLSTANVLPSIGVLDAGPARAMIREVFIRHVIGGKRLSRGAQFASLVRAATPDAVLAGVEVLADGAGGTPGAGDVLVVDVGGATTDVYSVVTPDPEESTLRREVVEVTWRGRTVEGDLGVRSGAGGVVDDLVAERSEPLEPVLEDLGRRDPERLVRAGHLQRNRGDRTRVGVVGGREVDGGLLEHRSQCVDGIFESVRENSTDHRAVGRPARADHLRRQRVLAAGEEVVDRPDAGLRLRRDLLQAGARVALASEQGRRRGGDPLPGVPRHRVLLSHGVIVTILE